MSDDLVKRLRDPLLGYPDCFHQAAADRIEAQAAEITRLRAALATARRDGMEQAAQWLEELHKNHGYNSRTGKVWSIGKIVTCPFTIDHAIGYYRAIAEGVAHIRAAAGDTRPSEEIIREDRDAWPDHQANDPIRAAAGEVK